MSRDSRAWSYHAGRKRRNRVTVYHLNRCPWMMMVWREGGRKHARALGHQSRTRAMAQAVAKAGELGAALPRTYEPSGRLVAMRSDLVRVAAMQGRPNGVAPSQLFYRHNGAFTVTAVCAAFKGYRGDDAADVWTDAVERFGFTPAYANRRPTLNEGITDLRRVAHALGAPRRMPSRAQYDRLGRWQSRTVMLLFAAPRWDAIADQLGLEMDAKQRHMARKARRVEVVCRATDERGAA